jgi:hypothetical protein
LPPIGLNAGKPVQELPRRLEAADRDFGGYRI